MDDDAFNMSVRKFLKKVGVTAQREIEGAVRDGLASGKLKGSETIAARATITLDGLGTDVIITSDISLE